MKKTAALLSLIILACLATDPALAVLQLGFHVGMDRNARDESSIEPFTGPDLSGTETVSLRSGKITDPFLVGASLRFGALPFLDFEAGLEGSFASYKYGYQYGSAPSAEEEILFGRLSAYGNVKMSMLSLPMFKVYVGGGMGYHLMTPLISRSLVEKRLEGADDYELDIRSILDREGALGFHALGGLRIKPAFIPLAVKLEARYHMLPKNSFGDDTNRFLAIVLGLELGA